MACCIGTLRPHPERARSAQSKDARPSCNTPSKEPLCRSLSASSSSFSARRSSRSASPPSPARRAARRRRIRRTAMITRRIISLEMRNPPRPLTRRPLRGRHPLPLAGEGTRGAVPPPLPLAGEDGRVRGTLHTCAAIAALVLLALPARAAAPAPASVTPELVAAAQKEGRVVFYTSIELRLAERMGQEFEARYPGIAVQVERSGAERIFQRVAQEEESNVHAADLLQPQWAGKIVKAHPGYSGTIMTATFEQSQALGWDYFARLARQKVMQVQSATDPPKKLALGERPVMADGSEYVMFGLQASGNPVAIVYPVEGTPLVVGSAAVMKAAPHPNAARLFVSFVFARDGQQLMSDAGGLRSFHPDVREQPGRTPLAAIKLIKADPVEQERAGDDVKRKYAEYFGT